MRRVAEAEQMSRSTKWLLVYVVIGLLIVIVDIVAVERSKHRRRIPPPTTPSTVPGAELR